ncbi:neuropeptides capa receptor-like [Bolinopsis microptera]|uniref:neuropeptides capa receptor-like n=1 Tax=Bolinopsis microptera TaxID=2820187 RepID=UPI003078C474
MVLFCLMDEINGPRASLENARVFLLHKNTGKVQVQGSSVLINASLVSLFCIKGRYKKSYHQAYINLACSDLAFSLWGVAFTAPNYFFGRDEGVMCTAIPLIGSYLFTVNLSSVLPIAVDRLVAVYSPMRYKSGIANKRYCVILQTAMALGWIIPAVYTILVFIIALGLKTPLVSNLTHPTLHYHYCDFTPDSPLHLPFQLSRFIIFFLCAITLDVIIYGFIISKILAGKHREVHTTNNLVVIIRAALVCLVIFCSCTPYSIIILIPSSSLDLKMIGYSVYYIGCFANPFLYVVSSRAIRASLRRLTKRKRQSVRKGSMRNRRTASFTSNALQLA